MKNNIYDTKIAFIECLWELLKLEDDGGYVEDIFFSANSIRICIPNQIFEERIARIYNS